MCKLEMKNGQLEDLSDGDGTEIYSGQTATLQCSALSFVKVSTTNTLLNGNLANKTNVICKYDGRQPRWVDELTGSEVVCDKECFNDEDCIQTNMRFCIDHRYDEYYSSTAFI